ncbi:MAG: dihydrodipicolinate synthase family protein [Thermoplasmata archaeon]|jgi:dihydrodipicolinate synthase/N-acetylneuraminate lyase|nr:dihydrodipicolinate synthase family protein [Thermoplasmatales archaeon]HEU12598.1 dihydrodipicolinate synthase family protein [Euryarchaeota archaeon]
MNYGGIITPLITPVRKNNVDYESLGFLLDFLVENGIEGVFPGSSTGAFTLFSMKDHEKILEYVAKNLKKNVIKLAGISRNNIDETVELGRKAVDLGYDGAVVITPYYLKFGQEDLYNYYSIIAENLDMDIFIYNNPELSGNYIDASTISRLMVEYPNIVGVKDSSGDMRKFNLYFTDLPGKVYVFQGRDDLLLPSVLMGASGGVCGTSNFSPLIHEVFIEKSLEKHFKIVDAMKILRKYNNSVSYNYLFLRLVRNIDTDDYAIYPYSPLKKEEREDLENVIRIFRV